MRAAYKPLPFHPPQRTMVRRGLCVWVELNGDPPKHKKGKRAKVKGVARSFGPAGPNSAPSLGGASEFPPTSLRFGSRQSCGELLKRAPGTFQKLGGIFSRCARKNCPAGHPSFPLGNGLGRGTEDEGLLRPKRLIIGRSNVYYTVS